MTDRSEPLTLTIAGRAHPCPATLEVRNPATGAVFAAVPDAGNDALDAAIAAAAAAFAGWSARRWEERQAAVVAVAETIERHADTLASMLVREQGKPTAQAAFEIAAASAWCRATATMTLPDTVTDDGQRRVVTRHVPIGVVGAISPWNFPLLLSVWKIAPALLTGNTMVLKPSPFTPMTVLRLGELLRDVLPAGVLNVIAGGDDLGPAMTAHPGIAKISFTGSSATGRRVMASAAPTLKRLTLELGGNDAAIVLPDVDVAATAEKLFWSAFTNSGQVCIASKRVYVHDAIYDALLGALAELARTVPMGDGSEQGVALGPIQNRPQFERVRGLVAECEAAGYRLIRGRAPDASGGYFAPVTLVDDPPDDARIVREEQFGPILPLMRFTDDDDAVARANDSDMGLAATIWTNDVERARRMAERLEVGSVWINEALAASPFAAFAGHKQSGVGVENGIEGLRAFTQPKVVAFPKAG